MIDRIVEIIIACCIIVSIYISIYGFYQLWTRTERQEQLQAYEIKIVILNDKIYWLKQTNKLSNVLEQLLTPMQIDELELMSEQLRQRKEK